MRDSIRSLSSVLVILACLALIGFLVHDRVDGSVVLAVSTVTTLVAYFTEPPKVDPPSGVTLVAGLVTAALGLGGGACSALTTPQARAALEASQLMCVFTSEATHSVAVAAACGVDASLVPLVEDVLAQRDAAKQVGVSWPAADGGAP